jgi:hypothetical protein
MKISLRQLVLLFPVFFYCAGSNHPTIVKQTDPEQELRAIYVTRFDYQSRFRSNQRAGGSHRSRTWRQQQRRDGAFRHSGKIVKPGCSASVGKIVPGARHQGDTGRAENCDMSLEAKRSAIESSNADLAVSIHANTGGTSNGYLGACGVSTYYHNPFGADFAKSADFDCCNCCSKSLGQSEVSTIVSSAQVRDRQSWWNRRS